MDGEGGRGVSAGGPGPWPQLSLTFHETFGYSAPSRPQPVCLTLTQVTFVEGFLLEGHGAKYCTHYWLT